jgi:tetratricopeptide (TPR) repeat protein
VNRKLERFELAIKDYTNEIKYGPVDHQTGRSTNIKAYNNRAYCLAKLGNYQEAILDYTTVIQQDKHNIHALHNRGISYERCAKYKEAVRDFTYVIEIDPQNANAYFNRGCCYDSIGELDLAISDYSVALELDLRSGNEENQDVNTLAQEAENKPVNDSLVY